MKTTAVKRLASATEKCRELCEELAHLDGDRLNDSHPAAAYAPLIQDGGKAMAELERVLRVIAPHRFGTVGITLGRADGIAKFFAFSFVATAKLPLAHIGATPFWGSGAYAIYYRGNREPAYLPLSGTETPIYVGKTDPVDAFADSIETQGQTLFRRLREHADNIKKTELKLEDFEYRAATIQSGMQVAVEEFMIRLFRPIWNKSVGVCHGLGKHGDSARTRANKRSPWDTMHPGRKWAVDTAVNQVERPEIVARIARHFEAHPIIRNKAELFQKLSLG